MQSTDVLTFLTNYPCFHEMLHCRGQREVTNRPRPLTRENDALLSLEGEERRLGFTLVAAICITSGPECSYECRHAYQAAVFLARVYGSIAAIRKAMTN